MTHTIVSIGEALWDVFPDERRPGGAPCNVAYHAARLGNRGAIVTRVGRDDAGEKLITFLADRGVDTSLVQRDEGHATGTVIVSFVAREPRYEIVEDVAWDHMTTSADARDLVMSAQAVCFGSLAQRTPDSRDAIQQLVRDARPHAMTVFDANLRPPFVYRDVIDASLRLSDIVKMSRSEVDTVSSLMGEKDLVDWLLDDVGVRVVCITAGADGASITTRDGHVSVSGAQMDMSSGDFVGVGDAFIAAMTHKLVRDSDPREALTFANRYAALVATRKGAMPHIEATEIPDITA